MRLQLSKMIKKDDYFLHADMWNVTKFPIISKNIINVGLGESNLLNIAGGLASEGKNVYIYGVSGFIIHRLEQLKFSCLHFGAKSGKIIICNAGKYGYEKLGIGHLLNDDKQIMDMLNIPFYNPKDNSEFENTLSYINTKNIGIFYIQLGKDA